MRRVVVRTNVARHFKSKSLTPGLEMTGTRMKSLADGSSIDTAQGNSQNFLKNEAAGSVETAWRGKRLATCLGEGVQSRIAIDGNCTLDVEFDLGR